jgi:hypothetical protein
MLYKKLKGLTTNCADSVISKYSGSFIAGQTYTVRLLNFRTGIIKSICVKEITLLLFSLPTL